jgi:hypothetical protein
MMEKIAQNAELVVLVSTLVLYAGLSLWKFKRPTSEAGKAILSTLIKLSFFSLNHWGAKGARIPLTMSEEEVQRELDSLDAKEEEKKDAELRTARKECPGVRPGQARRLR